MSRNELTPAQRTLRLAVAAIAASFLTTWAFRTIEFRSECAEWLEEIHRLEHRAAAEDNPAEQAELAHSAGRLEFFYEAKGC